MLKKDLFKVWLNRDETKPFYIEYKDSSGNWLVRQLYELEYEYKYARYWFAAKIKGGKRLASVSTMNRLKLTDKTELSPTPKPKKRYTVEDVPCMQDMLGNDVIVGDYVVYNKWNRMVIGEVTAMIRHLSAKTGEETFFKASIKTKDRNSYYEETLKLHSKCKERQFSNIVKMNDEDRLIHVLKN